MLTVYTPPHGWYIYHEHTSWPLSKQTPVPLLHHQPKKISNLIHLITSYNNNHYQTFSIIFTTITIASTSTATTIAAISTTVSTNTDTITFLLCMKSWVEKRVGGVLQSNLKFDQHITLKKDKTSKTLGAIKHILKQAPQKGRLLAYTSLCRPILEYADTVCDPTLAKEVESLEMLQHSCLIHCQIERTGECYGGVPWTWATASQTDAKITDYLFWWKSYRMKSEIQHYR